MITGMLRSRPLGPLNPFEVYLLCAAVVQGVSVLVRKADPTSINQFLPPWLRVAWAALLAIGGTLSLIGLTWRGNPFVGIEIKRVGLAAAGFGAFAYAIALFAHGPTGLVAAMYPTMFAFACAARIWQIRKALRVARAYLSVERHRRPRKAP